MRRHNGISLRKWLANPRYRRVVYVCFVVTGAVLNFLPRRIVFLFFVLSDVMQLTGRGHLKQAYLPYASLFLAKHPEFRFSTFWTRPFRLSSVILSLYGIGAYQEVGSLLDSIDLQSEDADVRYALTRSFFELGEFDKARLAVLGASEADLLSLPELGVLKAMLEIIAGDEAAAIESFDLACCANNRLFRPHQNIASRIGRNYVPNSLDTESGAPARLFDLCNFAGQRVTHVGRGDVGIRLYERALDAQEELRKTLPRLSADLERLLETLDVRLDELRIIPEEWITQIGHLGMLDILFRMRELGWWSGNAIMVVRPGLIANKPFFRLFESFGKLVIIGETVSEPLGAELLSLQRWYGLNFNAFRFADRSVVPWQDAGARAIDQWEREGRGCPLRDAYDRLFGVADVAEEYRRLREAWGMKPDDWYVCLHTRDASHYLELSGTGQTHRNSSIEECFDAIRFVTSQGGWVIKLGGPKSPKLPKWAKTIDYAVSKARSDIMDIHLIRHARAFIGTTSGLTNVAVSFGVPSAIVNAISTDAQMWHRSARFALKLVQLADGTALTQRQLSSSPWRWRVFDATILSRAGGHPVSNSLDEILEAVKEVEAIAGGREAEIEAQDDAEILWARWRGQISEPYYYGASRPSLYYLRKHQARFLADP
jgi:putative glycosyltransferase (TIGR04372 family)